MKLVVHLADFGWPVEADELAGLLGDVARSTTCTAAGASTSTIPTGTSWRSSPSRTA